MKKKKPKKSSAKKSPPKGASSAKESPTTSLSNKALSDSSDVKDDSSLYSKVASDAQIGLFAEEVSQQSREAPDLSDIPTGSTSSKIEIVVVSADPSSLNLADLDLVPQTVAGSDDSILRSTDLSPDVKATSSPAVSQAGLLVLASADANVSLSLQIAEKTVSNVVPDPATDTDKNTSLVKQAAQLKSQSNSGTEENSSNHLEKPLTAHIEATKTNPDPTETWCTHAKGYGKPLKKQGGTQIILHSKLGTEKDKALGESSNTPSYLKSVFPTRQGCSAFTGSSHSDVEPDSSDSELEDGEFSKDKKIFSGLKGNWGRGPKQLNLCRQTFFAGMFAVLINPVTAADYVNGLGKTLLFLAAFVRLMLISSR
ncbi:BnaCnng46550D [Brassica napus]|uniref:BnaCnng46550D protein n=1 Tax=Brassica napus TaxID=3708 RepID=A0A078JIY1_BRANA|nr:BnaCnng46550D [Brassica napus]